MIIKYKSLNNSFLREYELSTGEVIAEFKLGKEKNYLVFEQDSPYSLPYLLFIEEKDIAEFINSDNPESWVFVEKYTSKCYYGLMLHFELKMSNIKCYQWMIDNNDFFANVIDDVGASLLLLYKYMPNIFINQKDIEIWS